MNNNTNVKAVIIGWITLGFAYAIGRKHGRKECIEEVKDFVINQLIEEKKAKGS